MARHNGHRQLLARMDAEVAAITDAAAVALAAPNREAATLYLTVTRTLSLPRIRWCQTTEPWLIS